MSVTTQTAPGSLIREQTLFETVIQSGKIPVVASLFDIFPGKGTQRKLFSVDDTKATIYPETGAGNSIVPNSTTFALITFNQKRMGDAIPVTKQLIHDNGVNLGDHNHDILAKRILKGSASQAFGYGNADGSGLQFQSILDYNSQTEAKKINKLSIAEFTGATVENLDLAYGVFTDNHSGEAVIAVDSAATALGLKDETGKLLKTDNRANGGIGTIYGIQVYVQDMNEKAKIVLMDPKAYAISVREGIDVFTAEDRLNARFIDIADIYSQGLVVNPTAIVIIK